MSSVLHVFSSVSKVKAEVRASLYKAVSNFWITYRKSNIINANIMFRLREIRNCLCKIKDDHSGSSNALRKGGNVIDTVLNLAQKEYFAAIGSFVKILDVSNI